MRYDLLILDRQSVNTLQDAKKKIEQLGYGIRTILNLGVCRLADLTSLLYLLQLFQLGFVSCSLGSKIWTVAITEALLCVVNTCF